MSFVHDGRQRGSGLMEMILALSLIMVLMLVVLFGFSQARFHMGVAETSRQMIEISDAVKRHLRISEEFTGQIVRDLVPTAGYHPLPGRPSAISTSAGGVLEITNANGTGVEIQVTWTSSVGQKICRNLLASVRHPGEGRGSVTNFGTLGTRYLAPSTTNCADEGPFVLKIEYLL